MGLTTEYYAWNWIHRVPHTLATLPNSITCPLLQPLLFFRRPYLQQRLSYILCVLEVYSTGCTMTRIGRAILPA